MKSSRLTLQGLALLLLASTYAANADASDGHIINGIAFSTASQLLPNSFANRIERNGAQRARVERSSPREVTEEMVVTATRIKPKKVDIAPPLQRLFNEMEMMKVQKRELVWLSSLSDKSRSRVAFGYDPKFEFNNRFTATLPGASSMERQTPAVVRLSF